jgi:lipoic acid synthetase
MAVVVDLLNPANRPRHPEKAHRADKPLLPKPAWIPGRAR